MSKVFDDVSSNPWFSISYSILIITGLYLLSNGRTGSANPFYTYMIMLILLIVLGANAATSKELSKVLGFKEPYTGYNILSFIFGASLMSTIYGGLIYRTASIVSGNSFLYSLIKPFYLPSTLSIYSVGTFSLAGINSILFYFVLVAPVEEIQKLFFFKNLTNYFTSKGIKLRYITLFTFLIANLLWALFHYFAWGGLTLGSIVMAVMFGFIFWLPYFVADLSGILTPQKSLDWTGILLSGSLGAHGIYDVLLSMGETPFLPPLQFASVSAVIAVLSLVGMWLIKKKSINAVPIIQK